MDILISTVLAGLSLLLGNHQLPIYHISDTITYPTPVATVSTVSSSSLESATPVITHNAAKTVSATILAPVRKQPAKKTLPSVKGFDKAQVKIGPNASARIIDLDQVTTDVDASHKQLTTAKQQKADQELLILLGSLGFGAR